MVVAVLLQVSCWGFTVDDAWIISRVAHLGATTGSFSVNPSGPVTDAVTPIGFAQLLSALAAVVGIEGQLGLWQLARTLGALSYLCSMVGAAVWVAAENKERGWWYGVALVAFCLPAAAWSGAGLTAPLVGGVLLLGAKLLQARRRWIGGGVLGLAVAWRPELFPFALSLVALKDVAIRQRLVAAGALLLPPLFVAFTRFVCFGRWLPLSALAKPPDLGSGVFYAAMTAIWGGLGWLLVTRPGAWKEKRAWPWAVHLLALVYAGGDWMPALRLSVPVLPWMVWAVGRELKPNRAMLVAFIPAIGFPASLFYSQGADWRAVAERRVALIDESRPHLKSANVVATVDIGWVGIATEARLVDLAGVTDPRIAPLPGGHTSKLISPGLFSDRKVDTWVIRALDRNYRPGDPLQTVIPAYLVDARLLARNSDLGFMGVATVPLAGTAGQYVIARRLEVARR